MSPRLALPARAAVLAAAALAVAATAAQAGSHRVVPIASVARALPGAAPETVIQDDATLLHGTDSSIADALAKIKALGIGRIRVTAGWSVIAPKPDFPTRPDFDPTDPGAYPLGNWTNLDRIVRMASAAGLKVMIDIAFWAPRWATHSDPSETTRLRTDIDPTQYALFAQAVARRYSGGYRPVVPSDGSPPPQPEPSPDGDLLTSLLGGGKKSSSPPPAPAAPALGDPLPVVDTFTIWNEPNHPGFLMPQWTQENGQWVAHSADVYRAMVRAAYPAIKAVAPNSRVLIGGTASMGSSTSRTSGVPPLAFLRRLTCVDTQFRPIDTGACAGYTPLPGDGWAHHPYSLRTLPDALPNDGDKLPVASTGRLLFALKALVRMNRLAPANADLYLTEYGYETSPPDPQAMFGPERQAQLLAWAEFLGTRDPHVKMWPQFLLIDRPGDAAGPQMRAFGDWQTGLYYADGTPKPAAATFRTPTFAGCVGSGRHRQVMVWGRVRDGGAGEVAVDVQRGAGFAPMASAASAGKRGLRTVARVAQVGADREVLRFVPFRRGARYRLRWLSGGQEVDGPVVAPVSCPGAQS